HDLFRKPLHTFPDHALATSCLRLLTAHRCRRLNCCSNTTSLCEGVGAVLWPGGERGGGSFPDRFLMDPAGPIRCGMSISRQVRSLGIDTVSRRSSRHSLSEGARVDENSRLKFVSAHPWQQQQPGSVRASVTYRTR